MGERRVATTQENATNQVMRVDTELSVGQLPGTDQDQNRGSIMLSYPQVGRQGRGKEKEGNGCRLERGSYQHGLELLDSPRKKYQHNIIFVPERCIHSQERVLYREFSRKALKARMLRDVAERNSVLWKMGGMKPDYVISLKDGLQYAMKFGIPLE
ncbi:hypothetical protein ACFX1S_005717 [Malus domestica]